MDDAIEIIMRLGRGCLLAKTDIRNAFRLCPVHPDDYHLLGITWMGHYYYDRVLPFGLRSAPFIFNQVADALQWICLHHFHIGELIHLLDDVDISADCRRDLQWWRWLLTNGAYA